VGAAIHAATSGLPFLCQLVLERLWLLAEEKTEIGVEDVEAVVAEIVDAAPRDIHFTNIYEIVANDPRQLEDLGRLLQGKPILQDRARELRLSGLTDGRGPFLNAMYRRVFGRGGPLDLESLAPGLPPAEEKPVLLGLNELKKIAPAAMASMPSMPAPAALPKPTPAPPPPSPEMAHSSAVAPGAALDLVMGDVPEPMAEDERELDDAPISEERPKLEEAEKKAEEAAPAPEVAEKIDIAPEKPTASLVHAGKRVASIPPPSNEPGKSASRFGPVATILSFAAAAVLSIFVAQQGGLFAQRDAETSPPSPPGSASGQRIEPIGTGAMTIMTAVPMGAAATTGAGDHQMVFATGSGMRTESPPLGKMPRAICGERTTAGDAACIYRTEVTVGEYESCVAAGACEATEPGPLCNAQGEGLADLPMNCVSYAQAAAYCRFVGKRLPTDGEWEAAASAGDFVDLAGNVAEWTSTPGDTCKADDASCRTRIVRGSSWFDADPEASRFARKNRAEDASTPTVGFRCVN
jgi:hypothetical protein